MKKTDSNSSKETLEQELKRLRKENARLKAEREAAKAKMEADKAKIAKIRKELKKKEEPKQTKADELIQSILSRLPDIDSQFK